MLKKLLCGMCGLSLLWSCSGMTDLDQEVEVSRISSEVVSSSSLGDELSSSWELPPYSSFSPEPLSSSSGLSSLDQSSSSNVFLSSSSINLDPKIWEGGMGGQVAQGGYWHGLADIYGSTWGCGEIEYKGTDAASMQPCDNGTGMKVHLTVKAGTNYDTLYGTAGIGFNLLYDSSAIILPPETFNDNIASAPAYKNAANFRGLCVQYQSDAKIHVNFLTENDKDGDRYGGYLKPSSTSAFLAWPMFRRIGWGEKDWTFDSQYLYQIQFVLKEDSQTNPLGHDLLIKKVEFCDDFYWAI